jgi:hypothetical protein
VPLQQQQEQRPSDLQRYFLENGVSIDLGPNWKPSGASNAVPPGGLGPYAPPFRFNQILFLTNEHQYTLLQLATSDNALVGHDAYWLDTQMHATNGSGMSLPDYLFFLFLPPSHSCMDDVLAKLAAASRPADPDPTGEEFSKSELQVTYSCAMRLRSRTFIRSSSLPASPSNRRSTARAPMAISKISKCRRWSRWIFQG